jgi:hypothetical protein
MKTPHDECFRTAVNDRERRGILIPANQLDGSGLSPGDRFALKKGQRELFAVTIVKDPKGDILFDRSGIFIERTRRVDILLGGIFDRVQVEVVDGQPPALKLKTMDQGLTAIKESPRR